MPLNEADACRLFVTPKLQAAGWESSLHSLHEQKVLTDGRVLTASSKPLQGEKKRADYIAELGVAIDAVIETPGNR